MQALLIYELGNKNHLKNINDQNFAYFMRGYDKGFYGILPIPPSLTYLKKYLKLDIIKMCILMNFYNCWKFKIISIFIKKK